MLRFRDGLVWTVDLIVERKVRFKISRRSVNEASESKVRGGHMVRALNSELSGLGLSSGRGHCVVFLGKTLHSHRASLHPDKWVQAYLMLRGKLGITLR